MTLRASDLTPIPTARVNTRFRKINTPIPEPSSLEVLEKLRRVEPRSMAGMPPVLWDSAEGFLVRDPYGNQWIDLSSGIVVANVGHAHPEVLAAIRDQMDRRLIFSYTFPTRIRAQYLERLVGFAPDGFDKAVLFSSGTEAVECSLGLMRKAGRRIADDKVAILSLESSFHGRTLGASLAGGPPGLRDGIRRESVYHHQLPVPGGSSSSGFIADLNRRNIDPKTVAGIILESIPGWSTTPYPLEYMTELMDWAAQHHVLVAVDEIQSGMGRTGRMFAFEHYGITPHLIVCGKGLSSSLPVSAVIGGRELMDLSAPGEMSSTFSGSPLCIAASLASLEVLEKENLVERSEKLGQDIRKAFDRMVRDHSRFVRASNGYGLFYSLHLKDPETGEPLADLTDDIVMTCVRRGVLMFLTGRGFFKITPPLTIDRDALLEALGVIEDVLSEAL